MKETQQLINPHLQDINPILAGWSYSGPGDERCPEVLNYTLLHYVCSGKGRIHTSDGSFDLVPGQAFLIFPGDHVTHVSDKEQPWTIKWVGFTGMLSHSFVQLPRVFHVPPQFLPNLRALEDINGHTAFDLASDLLLLYSRLIRQETKKPDYVQFVMDYIQISYMHKLSVQSIADQLNLDRSYLARQFKKRTNQSIQSYILNVRLMEAKRYLMQGYTVKEAAGLCGFNDTANFSKLFAREDGLSPQAWKKVVRANLAAISEQEK
ncbi:MAG: AraC family transcriptional regulator [Oscillospiraceae bacterium]|nr:AraC family transcriptional regulator [Oscillospiraceae bacterium]